MDKTERKQIAVYTALFLGAVFVCISVLLLFYADSRRFIHAAEDDNWQAVSELLKEGVPPEILERDGKDVLYAACKAEETQVIDLLIEQGVEINGTKNEGTPLLYCLNIDKLNSAKHLIDNGADVNIRGWSGFPIHAAIYSGSVEGVRLLIEAGADLSAKTRRTDWTPLHLVIRVWPENFKDVSDRPTIVKLLIENGADVNAYNDRWRSANGDSTVGFSDPPPLRNDGGTPLELAISNGFDKIVKLLKENGATLPEPRKSKINGGMPSMPGSRENYGMPGMPNE